MSLDLSNTQGIALAGTAITASTSLAESIFDAGAPANESTKFVVKVDTTAGDVALDTLPLPSTLSFLSDGAEVSFIKTSVDNNKVTADDATPGAAFSGFTGVNYEYVNKQGESITLVANKTDNNWAVSI